MVIQSYDVKTNSQRTFLSVQSTTMIATRDFRPVPVQSTQQQSEAQPQNQGQQEDTVVLSERSGRRPHRRDVNGEFKRMHLDARDESLRQIAERSSRPHAAKTRAQKASTRTALPSNPYELKAYILQMMLELLTGKKSDFRSPVQTGKNDGQRNIDLSGIFGGFFGSAPRAQSVSGWSIEHFEYESEQVSYQAQGVVHTADGRTINVDINMFMSRQFMSYMNISVESMRPVDPLVINYGGTAASLTGDRFHFDLSMDGNPDSLAVLGEGSGFLAIDRNGDGKINDGSELFGPSTGCGFSELRKYDTDGNGWIDANDEIFDKLVVWRRDKDGNDIVYTLKELGIGAIYLGEIATEFSFKGDNNETLGIMRSTSFFLMENTGAGTISHIDMMI